MSNKFAVVGARRSKNEREQRRAAKREAKLERKKSKPITPIQEEDNAEI